MQNQYYILLCYYPEYFKKALGLYRKMLKAFPELQLFIIDNSVEKVICKEHPNLMILEGDNTLGEFSGWQKAIDQIMLNKLVNSNDTFIFANDTANTHRCFTFIDHWLFRRAIKNNQVNSLVGEINSSKKYFTIKGVNFNQWASTYLFSLSGAYFLKNNGCIIPTDIILPIVDKVEAGKIIFSHQIDNVLSQHINTWLFPSKAKKGWYASTTASAELVRHKATMIVLEKALSWKAQCLGFTVVSLYNSSLKKKYKKRMNKIYRTIYRR